MPNYTAYMAKMGRGNEHEHAVLEGPNCMARVATAAGFNLYSWIAGGRELMMPTQNVARGGSGYGTPILFPTPNLVRDATYTFEGHTHTLVKHGKPRHRHGLALDEPFTNCRCWADDHAAYCEGVMRILPGDEVYQGYPYANSLTVRLTLTETGIAMDFAVENLGDSNMPFGVAIHPYFTKTGNPGNVYLSCPVTHRYLVDEQTVSTGELMPVQGEFDLAGPVSLSAVNAVDMDTDFSGMNSRKSSRIEFRDWDYAVTLNADDDFGVLVVYAPRHRPGFCIEPQTCSTDAINLYNRGLAKESGLLVLAPGKTWKGQVRLALEEL